MAINARTEGLGIRAAGRVLGKSPGSIIRWEARLSAQLSSWSPPSPEETDIMVEGDEVYTRVGENHPPLAQ